MIHGDLAETFRLYRSGSPDRMIAMIRSASPEERKIIEAELAQYDREQTESAINVREWREEYDRQDEGYGFLRHCAH